MTLRDWIGVVVGASLSFALGWAAVTKDPAKFMRWGFFLCLALLVVLLTMAFLRRPWMSAHVTPLQVVDGRVVLRVGFRNHGYQNFGQAIVNVLVPDNAGLLERKRNGQESGERIDQTPESVDGENESDFWGHSADLVLGSSVVELAVDADRDLLPMKIRIGEPRRPLTVDLRKVGESHDVEFARVQPAVFRFLAWLPVVGGAFDDT